MGKVSSGFAVKKILGFVLLLGLAGTVPLFAIEIDLTPPVFAPAPNFPIDDEIILESLDGIIRDLNNRIKTLFNDLEVQLERDIGHIDPKKLMGAFANSSVFASSGATQRSHEGYDKFAVTIGPMVGLQLPSSPFSIAGELDDMTNNLQDKGDIHLGLNPQVLSAQIGINTSKFLLKNLYLGAKFGFMNLSIPVSSLADFYFNTFSVGLIGNYQLLPPINLAGGLVRWRGINVGTGFIYQSTSMGFGMTFETIERSHRISGYDSLLAAYPEVPEFIANGFTAKAEVTPEATLDFKINTCTIPLEALTSVRLLHFLNLSFGLGADIGFGSTTLNIEGDADVETSGYDRDYVREVTPAHGEITLNGSNSPTVFNPKIMTGLGFNFGPVIIDVPITIYPLDYGYSLGVTIGVAF